MNDVSLVTALPLCLKTFSISNNQYGAMRTFEMGLKITPLNFGVLKFVVGRISNFSEDQLLCLL